MPPFPLTTEGQSLFTDEDLAPVFPVQRKLLNRQIVNDGEKEIIWKPNCKQLAQPMEPNSGWAYYSFENPDLGLLCPRFTSSSPVGKCTGIGELYPPGSVSGRATPQVPGPQCLKSI